MPFDTRFCDGYLTIKPRKAQRVNKTLTPRSSANNVHHVQNIFHKTVEEGDMTQVKVLLRYAQSNIHLEEPNKQGRTAVQECCLKDNLEMIRLLLDHGASLESTDAYGWTALHYASFFGSLNIVRFLVLNCADLMQTNNSGEMAYDLAQNDDVKYYLHRMMMLRSDDDDDDDDDDDGDNDDHGDDGDNDNDGDGDRGGGGDVYDENSYRDTDGDERTSYYNDEDYFENSSDKLTWKHDSDTESLANSISIVDSCESQVSSPSWEEMRPVSSNQCRSWWLGQNLSIHAMKGINETEIIYAERKPKLGVSETNGIDEATQAYNGADNDASDDGGGDDDDDDDDDDECKHISVICGEGVPERSREVAAMEEQLNKEESIAQEIARSDETELIKDSITGLEQDIIVVGNEKVEIVDSKYDKKLATMNETRKGDNEQESNCKPNAPTNSCEKEINVEKRKKTEIPKIRSREKIKQKVNDSESVISPQISEKKIEEIDRNLRDMCDGEEHEKDKKGKGKGKNRSKIPSAIPRFKKRIGGEKENSKKLPILNKRKGGTTSTTSEGIIGPRIKDKSSYSEERSKKGLEGLWERFRLLAARRNSSE